MEGVSKITIEVSEKTGRIISATGFPIEANPGIIVATAIRKEMDRLINDYIDNGEADGSVDESKPE